MPTTEPAQPEAKDAPAGPPLKWDMPRDEKPPAATPAPQAAPAPGATVTLATIRPVVRFDAGGGLVITADGTECDADAAKRAYEAAQRSRITLREI
jgi:hypothetical protein